MSHKPCPRLNLSRYGSEAEPRIGDKVLHVENEEWYIGTVLNIAAEHLWPKVCLINIMITQSNLGDLYNVGETYLLGEFMVKKSWQKIEIISYNALWRKINV